MEREPESKVPALLKDQLFMSKVRDKLVELGSAPGLGLRVTGSENSVIVFPRAGTRPSTLEDYLRFTWMNVDANTLTFTDMTQTEADAFLKMFAPVTA